MRDGQRVREQLAQVLSGQSHGELAAFLEGNIEDLLSTPDVPEVYQLLREREWPAAPLPSRLIVAWMAFMSGDNAQMFALLGSIHETELISPEVSSLFYALKALVSGMIDRQEAQRYAQIALDVLPEHEHTLYLANAKLTYGQIMAGADQYRRAAEMFHSAHDIFQERGLQFLAMIALVNELLNRFHLGELQAVVDRCNQALLMSGNFTGQAEDFWNVVHLPLGMCYYELGKPHLAVTHLQQCKQSIDRIKMLHLHGLIEAYLFKSHYLLADRAGLQAMRDQAAATFGHLHYPQMDLLIAMFRILATERPQDVEQADIDLFELAYTQDLDGHSVVPEVLVWLQLQGLSDLIEPEDLEQRLKKFKYIGNIPRVQLTELQLAELYLQLGQQKQAEVHLRSAVQLWREHGICACFGTLPLRSLERIRQLDRKLHGLLSKARPAAVEAVEPQDALLSAREREIVQLMAQGKTNADISQKLFISVGTIKWHINKIFSKLEVTNRVQAIEKAKALREIVE